MIQKDFWMEKPSLAIIVPCYNESEIIDTTFRVLDDVLNKIIEKGLISKSSYICFVDDGSKDGTWEKILNFKKKNAKGIKFSRNFGHQNALFAGLSECEADIFITIDADLQDDVEIIEKMVEKYLEGNEIVYGVRNDRRVDNFIKRNITELYYKLSGALGVSKMPNHADFRLISKKVANILKNSNEASIYLRGLVPSYGFKSDILYYARKKREGGEAKYNYFTLLELALNGITSFSEKPLRLIFILGLICMALSIPALIISILVGAGKGSILLLFSIWFLAGLQITALGIVAEYTGKIFKQTRNRPLYIVEEKIG